LGVYFLLVPLLEQGGICPSICILYVKLYVNYKYKLGVTPNAET